MLVMAIFTLVVIAALGAAMVKIINTSSQAVIHEVYGLRAKLAAQSGIQAIAQQAFPLNSAPTQCDKTLSSNTDFSTITGLHNCYFNAKCSTSNISFNGSNYMHVQFSSEGSCRAGNVITHRVIAVDAMQLVN